MDADYSLWRATLRGEKNRNYIRGLHAGFFRCRWGESDEWLPLAVFEKDGELIGLFRNEIYTADELIDILEIWPRAARYAVTEEDYRQMAEQGAKWDEIKPKKKNDK